ncbi:MAG: J domain-containing protein [Labilithrix sp.]|nr:J domain-containing protein [Labilithrix sp.]
MKPIEAYPLTWPLAYPRTSPAQRRFSNFTVDLVHSRDELLAELRRLGAGNAIISSNMPARRDGAPLANAREPDDPGVAVYFDRYTNKAWAPFVIACDVYVRVRFNLRAIQKTIDALRTIERHGSSAMLEQAFSGFAALPAAASSSGDPPWWETLGVARSADEAAITAAYRSLSRQHHPDVAGGSVERMTSINRARDAALAELAGGRST